MCPRKLDFMMTFPRLLARIWGEGLIFFHSLPAFFYFLFFFQSGDRLAHTKLTVLSPGDSPAHTDEQGTRVFELTIRATQRPRALFTVEGGVFVRGR